MEAETSVTLIRRLIAEQTPDRAIYSRLAPYSNAEVDDPTVRPGWVRILLSERAAP